MRLSKINYNTSECLPRHLIMVKAYDGIIRNCFLFNEFANLRKTTISFVMSVCLSAWNNSAPTGRIVMKSDILTL